MKQEYRYSKQRLLNQDGEVNENGEKHGTWRTFYSNGQLREIVTYDNGKKIDTVRSFHFNGKNHMMRVYDKNGKANGELMIFYSTGQLSQHASFRNNRLFGQDTSFYENGKINRIIEHGDSIKLTKKFIYSEKWKLSEIEQYENDSLIIKSEE